MARPSRVALLAALATAFAVVHAALAFLALAGPGQPIGDVTGVYRFWVETGLQTGQWVGIDTRWVYPILALPPMLLASVLGLDAIGPTWIGIVVLADTALFLAMVRAVRTPRDATPIIWWLVFLLALGPVAIGRIDALATPLAIAGLLAIARRPVVAGALLAVAAWIKVWPAALVAVAAVAARDRVRVVLGSAATTAGVLAVALALGGGATVFSFLGEQGDRGLQVEAVVATPFLWAAAAGGPWRVEWSDALLTFQLAGPGVAEVATAMTPVLVAAVAGILALGIVAVRRGAAPSRVLAPLTLAVTVALIVANKVGSPQFTGWIAAPIVLGLVLAARDGTSAFRIPAALALVAAGLTQLVYPTFYDALLALHPALLAVLSVRNAIDVTLLVWGLAELVRVLRSPGGGSA